MELQQWHSDTQPPPSKLRPGDPIFDSRYGFGTLQSLTRRDRSRPIHEDHPRSRRQQTVRTGNVACARPRRWLRHGVSPITAGKTACYDADVRA